MTTFLSHDFMFNYRSVMDVTWMSCDKCNHNTTKNKQQLFLQHFKNKRQDGEKDRGENEKMGTKEIQKDQEN